MSDGLKKNFEVVQDESSKWRREMPIHVARFQRATWIGEKLHTGVNLLTESIRLLPRTLAYTTVIAVSVVAVWLAL